jgi:FixJ family two-component response regulator
VLDNVEREILELRVKKFTNEDIAKQLGYKTQSAISKRLAKMRKKFDELIKEISEQLD